MPTTSTPAIANSAREPRQSAFHARGSMRPMAAKMMTAARVALGSRASTPVRNSRTRTAPATCTRPTIWVRPPTRVLMAVREPLDPSGNDCTRPAAALRPARPTSSWFALTDRPSAGAKLRAVRMASAKPTRATATATGASSSTCASSTLGQASPGSPGGISPTRVTPRPPRSKAHDAAMASTVTSRSIGNFGSQRDPTRRAPRHRMPTSSSSQSTSPMKPVANEAYSCRGVSPSTVTPVNSSSCPARSVSASPVRKPSRTDVEK